MQPPQLRPLGVGEMVDAAIKLYLRHASTLLQLTAIVLVPVTLIGLILQLAAMPDELVRPGGEIPSDELAGFIVVAILSLLLGFLATLLATGACFRAVSEAYLGRTPEVRSSLSFAARKLPSLILASIVVSIMVVVGFLAFIVPGIYLAVAFAVVIPVLLFEGVPTGSALRRSRDLVQGLWWPTFGTVLVGVILIPFIVGIIVTVVFGIILAAGAESAGANIVLDTIGGLISSLITTPLQAAVLTVLYFDLRVRKEGFDLQLLAQGIGPPAMASPGSPPAAPGP